MLDRGFRHFPVVSAPGKMLGVVEDLDLVAAQTRSSFFLRQRIAAAADASTSWSRAARELRPMVIAMHDARVAAANMMAVYAVVVDALTRRLLELAVARGREPGRIDSPGWRWEARRDARRCRARTSTARSCGSAREEERTVRPRPARRSPQTWWRGLERCGLQPGHARRDGVEPAVRALARLLAARGAQLDRGPDPGEGADPRLGARRQPPGVGRAHRHAGGRHLPARAELNPALLRLLARFALSHRPPTGFLRGLVVEHCGEHRGRLDLKHGGVIPIVDLARWAGMAAGVTSASTIERLRAAGAAGTLPAADAHTLEDAFELINSLRLEHQVEQLRAGAEPDDYVDPAGSAR